MILSVFTRDIVDDLLPPLVAKIHVDIRHGNAFRVQKALKEQVVLERIEHGDIQAVRHNAARAAAAPGADHDAVVLGVLDKIPHDQKVIHIAHLCDDRKLVFQPFARGRVVLRIARAQPLLAQAAQHAFARFALRHGIARQMDGMKIKIHPAAGGNLRRARNGVRVIGEQRKHLFLGFDEQFAGVHPHALFILERLARLDAHEHLLRVGVLPRKIVAVVRRHKRHARFFAHGNQPGKHRLFLRDAMIHDFNIEMLRAEYIAHHAHIRFGVLIPLVQQKLGQIPAQTRRQRNQPLVALPQQRIIDSRLVIITAGEGFAGEEHQIPVARLIFTQQNQMAVFAGKRTLVLHIGADIHFAADDRMNARLLTGGVELHRAVKHAVIRTGAGVHAQLLHAPDQPPDAARAVQQAVFRVQMQMRKRHCPFLLAGYSILF